MGEIGVSRVRSNYIMDVLQDGGFYESDLRQVKKAALRGDEDWQTIRAGLSQQREEEEIPLLKSFWMFRILIHLCANKKRRHPKKTIVNVVIPAFRQQ